MPLPRTQISPQSALKRQGTTKSSNPDVDHDQLSKLMSDWGVEDEEADISELLNRLETTQGVANGVEGKLDDILESLDTLLESVEGDQHGLVPPVPRPVVNSEVVKA